MDQPIVAHIDAMRLQVASSGEACCWTKGGGPDELPEVDVVSEPLSDTVKTNTCMYAHQHKGIRQRAGANAHAACLRLP